MSCSSGSTLFENLTFFFEGGGGGGVVGVEGQHYKAKYSCKIKTSYQRLKHLILYE